ncbi:IS66 family transposase [Puniceicoccus vermicola]|uniref:IS66 family transposase n=1 Tax=Puniceicoccus vermicola TaxID=388746 RepID=A0A7X1AXF1_9BACT|nr:IS66 family transposase [Puniceicoccus vermicola]MBC2601248.1 IS66 family transposase [Puniceicoccus vermicola]MBC2601702.1 IS66 family transposase [Puniceicoccus vermicola]MBC2601707.1 IS66 family transposase [Puniceicoccus vermicola]MBC2602953.1 IS66 family transposase [Puniceicoccus vermicola]
MPPTYDELRRENDLLKQQIAWFKRQLFGGGKSERIDRDQALLALEEMETRQKQMERQEVSYIRSKARQRSKGAIERFEKVPVAETVEIVPEEVKADPDLYEQIGAEETFEIDITPPKIFKRLIRRLKFRHRIERSLPPVVVPALERPVQGSYASAGLVGWVVLGKYIDHLPLYRQQKMFERWGAKISRQSMADWVQTVAFWLKPLYNHMRQELLESGYVQADETPVRFQDPDNKKGKTSQGFLWVVHSPGLGVVFDWRLSRRHVEATRLLEGFTGLLQTDGYEAYNALVKNAEAIIHLGCWAHARRGFFNARSDHPREASLILGLIGRLYDFEERYRKQGLSPVERARQRKVDQARILKWLKIAITISQNRCLSQSNLGKACSYALARWKCLCRYLHHGEAEIDNNLVENKIRPSAIGKKNWLFIGSPDAGERTAVIYSMLLTCEIHGVDPHAWLPDVLTKAPKTPEKKEQIKLLPHNWQQ